MKLEQMTEKSKKVTMEIPRSEEYYMAEAYRSLRTNLLFCGEEVKSIAMVSSLSGEGTTSVTWNLALSLAEIGKKVLVVDANMRKSTVAQQYHVTDKVTGLAEYLSGTCNLESCVCKTSYEHLYAVFAGNESANSSELLSRGGLEALLEESKEAFDYVLVDCPPLGNTIDGAVIAKVCDASVIVLEADKTNRKMIQSVKAQLEKADSKILGVVLNKFNAKRHQCYGNYYGKKYGE